MDQWDDAAFVARARKAIARSGRAEGDVLIAADTSRVFLSDERHSTHVRSLRVIQSLAHVLDVDPGWLAFGTPGVRIRHRDLEQLRALLPDSHAATAAIDKLLLQTVDE